MAQPATDLPTLSEMETIPQTQNYRVERLKLWRLIQEKRKEYEDAARKHGATDEAASQAADRHVRGEVNIFLDELFTHSRVSKAADFVMAAPREWGVRSELLLDVDPLVPNMIAASYPSAAWAGHVDAVERAVADDQKSWALWLSRRLEAVGHASETAALHVYGAVEKVAEGVGEGIGGLGKGLGEGIGGLGKGIGSAVTVAVGVFSLGVVVVGGIWILKR